MTNWTDRKKKSLSSVPLWFEKAVEEYQKQKKLQSWSHALMHLAVFALLKHYSEPDNMVTFGDREFEDEMFKILNEREEAGDDIDMYQFWQELLKPPKYGGDRKSEEQIKKDAG